MFRRRANWQADEDCTRCTSCNNEFTFYYSKHHCRLCGLIFCDSCTRHKLIVPEEDLVLRPRNFVSDLVTVDEDEFRTPHRICDACAPKLVDKQDQLKAEVSRCNMETSVDEQSSALLVPQINFFLENEIKNATVMIQRMSSQKGEERIPADMLEIAKGVAFLTVVKIGMMFTGKYGTGLVVSRLPDGSWSAPSAITVSGFGWGLQFGGEITDVMLVLATESAVEAFKSRGQMSIGAELGVSAGPYGRAVESDITAGNKGAAHAFSYAHSQGLFIGASLEACVIGQRRDVNRVFYGQRVKAGDLLGGKHPRPRGAEVLYKALDNVLYNGEPPFEVTENRIRGYQATEESMKEGGTDSGVDGTSGTSATADAPWPTAGNKAVGADVFINEAIRNSGSMDT
jgi:SH3 domain-containing YSC84-like protein 1